MAFTVIQAGSALQLMDSAGNLATITLPTNIVLSTTRPPRFAIFGRYVVMVNSPNRPITIDGDGIARVLTPRPPATALVLSAQGVGNLTGAYCVRQTFRILDTVGNIIAESGYGSVAGPLTLTAQQLRAANADTSPDNVTSSMFYRTTAGGGTDGPFFPWVELGGNTQTSVQDDLSDAGMSLVAAADLGSAPDLTLIAEFRDRLFGVDRFDVDNVRYTEAGTLYGWTAANRLAVPKVGSDSRGITGIIGRREALALGRRNVMRQITGDSNTNFAVVDLTENIGIESQETVCVYRNIAYWLWKDGVYQWDDTGFMCISDGIGGHGNVRSWFATNSYFNRAEFDHAFAMILPDRNVYRLFLCSAGSTTIDRFVDFDLTERIWFGPHKTSALTPSCALTRPDSDDVLVQMVGSSSGYLWQEQDTRSDGTFPIVMDVDTKRYDARTPKIDKFWDMGAIITVPQTLKGNFVITPSVGEIDADPNTLNAQPVDCRESVQSLARMGTGKFLKLNLYDDKKGHNVKIIGFEIPHHELGERI